MTRIVVNKSTDHAKPHFNSFLPQYQHHRKCFFQSTSWESYWVTHWHEQCCLDTLINNHGKLANQIVRLVTIVVKKKTFYEIKMQVVWHYCYLSYGIEETAGLLAFSVNVKFPLSSNLEGMRSYHVFLNHCNLWSFKCHKETILYIHDYAQASSVFP